MLKIFALSAVAFQAVLGLSITPRHHVPGHLDDTLDALPNVFSKIKTTRVPIYCDPAKEVRKAHGLTECIDGTVKVVHSIATLYETLVREDSSIPYQETLVIDHLGNQNTTIINGAENKKSFVQVDDELYTISNFERADYKHGWELVTVFEGPMHPVERWDGLEPVKKSEPEESESPEMTFTIETISPTPTAAVRA